MTPISANLQAVKARIADAARAAGRAADAISLLAVSKTFDPAQVRACHAAGQRAFGENYLQEALDKIATLADCTIEWHMIGPIQSNKTRPLAEHFQWVHSVERAKIALRLNQSRPTDFPPLNICIQVNVSGEASKAGIAPGAEIALAELIAGLPRLRLRGLMTIPEPTSDSALRRQRFARLRDMQENLSARGHMLDTLSMGMSDDLEDAIAEGATMVRVGTAIFGRRA
jgi:pyridoxal phosphate enzyme (YggS family)